MAVLMVHMLAALMASAGSQDTTPKLLTANLLCKDAGDQCSGFGETSLGLLQRQSLQVVAKSKKWNPQPWWSGPSASMLPVAWLHIPKCGSSFLNALIHIPGACRNLPENLVITDQTMGPDNLAGFWNRYPTTQYCPTAFLTYGNHDGVGNSRRYHNVWKGHGMTMLRQPAQRLLSAFHDNRHSWPASAANPPPWDLYTYAVQLQGCVARMLTRPGASHSVSDEVPGNFGGVGPHWGGPCGGEGGAPGSTEPVTWAEVAEAQRRLREGFVFVGLDEEWELSMCLFHATVGGKCHSAEFVDSRHQVWPKHSYDESKLAIINFTDPYDGAVYKYAQDLFWERFAEHNLTIEVCQQGCFAEANITFPQ